MSGKRLFDSSLVRTTFTELVSNGGEFLSDWDGLAEARPIPAKLLGNAYWQGSNDGVTWSDTVLSNHTRTRLSTDGGTTWLEFQLPTGTEHPALTIGTPSSGLAVSGDDTQILTLSTATTTNAGALSASDKVKLNNLKFDTLSNIGTGVGLYKDAITVGQDTTHNLKTLVAGSNVTFTVGTDSIQVDFAGTSAGEANTASNQGAGVGIFDNKNGIDLELRTLISSNSILDITLDALNKEIDFTIDESVINHDNLTGFVTNEHIDHSSVSISTSEGITGGGNLTSSRTLTLSFDTLTQQTNVEDTDKFAFYRNSGGEDEHYQINYADFKTENTTYYNTIYVPLTTSINTGVGLTGGGTLDNDRTIQLDFNALPTVSFESGDYLAIWDVSNLTHAKVAVSDLSVSITAGDGMDFTTITNNGPVTLGTPTTLTKTTTNSVSSTSHQHIVDLSTFLLTDLGDVSAPTANYYLRRNAGDTAYEWADPTIGASTPGGPTNSLQFNASGSFGGNTGLLYDSTTDTITFSDANAASGVTLILGDNINDAYIKGETGTTNVLSLVNNSAAQDYIKVLGGRVLLGDPTLDGTTFLDIKDSNGVSYSNIIRVTDTLDEEILQLTSTGQLYMPKMNSAVTSNLLYIDSTTGLITYGAAPTGGAGIQTVNTGSTSGLSVNGGNSSSASTITLEQSDLKLPSAVPSIADAVGFYDISTGLQSKTTFESMPGWNIHVDGVNKEEIHIGDIVNFAAGTNTELDYNSSTNTLTITNTTPGLTTYEDIAFEFADLSTGTTQYTLDIKATFDYTIVNTILETDDSVSGTITGGATTITYTNVGTLQEIGTTSVVTNGSRVYLNVTAGHSATVIRGKLVIQRN